MSKERSKSQISANTLFHYTRKMDYLISILSNEFYPRYCLEESPNIIFGIPRIEMAIPMVCFCDIPLSQVEQHVTKYGSYAIGLSKKWGMHNKINPVLYTYHNSAFANLIAKLWDKPFEELIDASSEYTSQIETFFYYLKPYEGYLWKNGIKKRKKETFYDEREWRYVPYLIENTLTAFESRQWLMREQYLDETARNAFNQRLEGMDVKLNFVPDDIKYIIVKKESERASIRKKLYDIKGSRFSTEVVDVLTTKILSMEQIMEDF